MFGLGKKLKEMLDPKALDSIADSSKAMVQKVVGKVPDSLKDSYVVDLLRETSGKLGAVLKGIDKVLDSKAKIADLSDKTKDLLKWGKSKAMTGAEKVKALFPNQEEVKGKEEAAKESDQTSTAPPSALKKATGAIGKWLSKKVKGKEEAASTDTVIPPAAPEVAAPIVTKKKGIFSKLGGLVVKGMAKLKKPKPGLFEEDPNADIPKPHKKSFDVRRTEASERFSASMEKLKAKMDFRKKEVDEEGNEIKRNKKPKKEGSFLIKILSAIVGLGGTVVKGIVGGMGSLFMKAIPLLGRTLMSGVSLLLKGLPGLGGIAGGIAKATQGGVVGAIKGLATGAAKIATSKALWGGIGNAARVAGSVALRAGGMLLTGPVGWAVAAGTVAYAGYKYYKYLNRNNVSNLTKLRLLQYGMDETKKENYYKLIALEDILLKSMVLTPSGGYAFKGMTKDLNDEIMELFKLDEEDENIADKKAVVGKWLSQRFLPVYKMHLDALSVTDSSKKLEDIDSLDKALVAGYINKAVIPASIYDVTKMVLEKEIVDITITKDEITDYQTKLLATYKSVSTDKPSDKIPKLPQVKSTPEAPPTPKKDIDTKKPTGMAEDLEPPKPEYRDKYDIKADAKTQEAYTDNKTTDKEINAAKPINKLGGPMVTPGADLEGIKLVNDLAKEAIYNLDPNVNTLFTSMAAEYKKLTGKDVPVVEGFRSRERQEELYRKYPDRAAKPGSSTHEFGLAVDVDSAVADELDKLGLLRKYGFTRPIGKEKWHLEPIGVSLDPTRAKATESGRISAVEGSVGKGGGGYGTLPDSVLKKRNIPYQVSLYTNGTDNKVDEKSVVAMTTPVLPTKDTAIVTTKADTPAITPDDGAIPGMTRNRKRPSKEPAKEVAEDITPPTADASGSTRHKRPSIDMMFADSLKKDVTTAYNKATDLSTYKDLTAQQAIQKASELTGVDVKTLTRFAEIESSMRTDVKAKTSSATGLFQFTDDTWKYMLKKHASTYNIPLDAKPDNTLYNSILAGQYIKDNLAELGAEYKQTGMDDTTAAYLAHHYGPTGAKKFIDTYISSPDTKAADVVSTKTYAANKQELGDNTVKTYVSQVAAKVNKTPNLTTEPSGKSVDVQQAIYKPPQDAAATNTAAYTSGAQTASQKPSSGSSTGMGLQTAMYRPSVPTTMAPTDKSTPEIKTSVYKYTPPTPVKPAKTETVLNNTASTTTIDLSSLETIAGKQLSVLETIRDLITSIAKTPPSQPNAPTPSRPTGDNRRILSNEKVDVSRKTYT